tara:strand:+ start:1692 stop:2174 length:483 start_codon:yes stop_codon:yes gene_type:complete
MQTAPKYSVDTSALIHAWRRSYPIRNFRPVWDRLDTLIDADRLFSSKEVFLELKKWDDDLFNWCKDRERMFVDIDGDSFQENMAHVMGTYPRLVDTRKNKSGADPFVIVVALSSNPPLVVVTQEGATGNLAKPNIPDVCTAEGVECINILDLIVREDWIL